MILTRRTAMKGGATVLALSGIAGGAGAAQPEELIITALVPGSVSAGEAVTINGRVTWGPGNPAVGARVLAALESQPPDSDRDTADFDGSFTVELTAPDELGSYTIRISATREGFLPTERTYTIQVE